MDYREGANVYNATIQKAPKKSLIFREKMISFWEGINIRLS